VPTLAASAATRLLSRGRTGVPAARHRLCAFALKPATTP